MGASISSQEDILISATDIPENTRQKNESEIQFYIRQSKEWGKFISKHIPTAVESSITEDGEEQLDQDLEQSSIDVASPVSTRLPDTVNEKHGSDVGSSANSCKD